MAVYWVNYDLKKQGQDYSRLNTYLRLRQDCKKVLESSFFVRTNLTAEELVQEIRKYIDSNDQVIVVEVIKDAGWDGCGLSPDIRAWMEKNIRNT